MSESTAVLNSLNVTFRIKVRQTVRIPNLHNPSKVIYRYPTIARGYCSTVEDTHKWIKNFQHENRHLVGDLEFIVTAELYDLRRGL